MQRSWALVRVETDGGLVGWGEASLELGAQLPDRVRDRRARRDRTQPGGRRRLRHPGPARPDARRSRRLPGLGGPVQPGDRRGRDRLWDLLGRAHGASVPELLGGGVDPIPLYGTGTTMFDESPEWHAHYFDQALAVGFSTSRSASASTPTPTSSWCGGEGLRRAGRPDRRRRLLGPLRRRAIALTERLNPLRRALLRGALPAVRRRRPGPPAARSPVRVAGGERIYSPAQYRMLARAGCDPRVPAGRLAVRRDPGVPRDRRHRPPARAGGDPPRRWPDRGRPGRQPAVGGGGQRADDRVGHRPAPAARRPSSRHPELALDRHPGGGADRADRAGPGDRHRRGRARRASARRPAAPTPRSSPTTSPAARRTPARGRRTG